MGEGTKSAIRHFLTAALAILGVLGLGEWVGFIELINVNLDAVWEAAITIIGFVGSDNFKIFFDESTFRWIQDDRGSPILRIKGRNF